MASEVDRQRWLDIFRKSMTNPRSHFGAVGKIASREAWLSQFWRSHDEEVQRLKSSRVDGELASHQDVEDQAATGRYFISDDDLAALEARRGAAENEGQRTQPYTHGSAD